MWVRKNIVESNSDNGDRIVREIIIMVEQLRQQGAMT